MTEADLVPDRIAEALGLQWGSGSAAEALVAALTEEPALILLDNLEQVVDCAPFIADLVAALPSSRFLTTSRESLRIRGEHLLLLAPMALPDPDTPVGSLALFEAVRFLIDRALAAKATFAVTNDNAPAVAAICARLEGHPLALELAAARLTVLTAEQLLARLDKALGLLTSGSRDMPARHQTLRATIAWSFNLLLPEEQQLLARISALSAPADLALLEAACRADLEVVESLMAKSLVRSFEGPSGPRFGLLVSIREFAAEHLSEVDRASVRDGMARHLLDTLRAEASSSEDLRGSVASRDLEHLRLALDHLSDSGPVELAVQLLVESFAGLVHLGHLAEVRATATELVARTSSSCNHAQLHQIAYLSCNLMTLLDEGRVQARLALEAARACGEPERLRWALVYAIGSTQSVRELESLLVEEAALPDPVPDDVFDERANLLSDRLRFLAPDRAEAHARRLITRPTNGPIGRARLTTVLLDRGDVAQALAVSHRLVEGFEAVGLLTWLPRAQAVRAQALLAAGDLGSALPLAQQAVDNQLALGGGGSDGASVLAEVHLQQGELASAERVLLTAGSGAGAKDVFTGAILRHLATVLRLQGRDAEAVDALERARSLLVADEVRGRLELLGCLIERALQGSDPQRAARLVGCVLAHRGVLVPPLARDLERLRSEADPPALVEGAGWALADAW